MNCILFFLKYMHNFTSNFIFTELSNSYFLYYSWIELRVSMNYRLTAYSSKPISLSWFKKVSLLLRNHSYSYYSRSFTTFNQRNVNSFHFVSLRNKIVENAIFNLIYPFFYVFFVSRSYFLSANMCFFNIFNIYDYVL